MKPMTFRLMQRALIGSLVGVVLAGCAGGPLDQVIGPVSRFSGSVQPYESAPAMLPAPAPIGPAPASAPIAALPGEAGRILHVSERRFVDGISQVITLQAPAGVIGTNRIEISVRTEGQGVRYDNIIEMKRATEDEIAQELYAAFPGVRMEFVQLLTQNAFGPYGVAAGRQANGVQCVFMWQWIDDIGAAQGGVRSIFAGGKPASIRVRLCHPSASTAQLARLMEGLSLSTPGLTPYASGGVMGGGYRAGGGYGGQDALAAAGGGAAGGYGQAGVYQSGMYQGGSGYDGLNGGSRYALDAPQPIVRQAQRPTRPTSVRRTARQRRAVDPQEQTSIPSGPSYQQQVRAFPPQPQGYQTQPQPSYAQPSYAQPGYAQPGYAQPGAAQPYGTATSPSRVPSYGSQGYGAQGYDPRTAQPGQMPSPGAGGVPRGLDGNLPAAALRGPSAVTAAPRTSGGQPPAQPPFAPQAQQQMIQRAPPRATQQMDRFGRPLSTQGVRSPVSPTL